MHTQNWNDVWNNRIRKTLKNIDLETLIQIDGFDTGAGLVNDVNNWNSYAAEIAKKLAIENGCTIFEIGCGAGAFLFALQMRYDIEVAGLDYSESLIEIAKRAMPDGTFEVMEAKTFLPDKKYDYVVANSVFQYFDLEYAADVLDRALRCAQKAVAIMDVPDLASKVEAEETRRSVLTPEEYERKYRGLMHTYYDRNWFIDKAKSFSREWEMFEGCIPNYIQNKFRFGCIIRN